MSDPNTEEDSLISQDDIDALLDGSSIEEAEENLEKTDDEAAGTEDLDELGELSQDDIDNLLGGSTLDGDGDADDFGDGGGELSQDDINSLLEGDAQEDESGELSQDDIDRLMNPDPAPEEDEDDEDMELISQDDIDRLMDPAGGDDPDDDDEMISMDDIQGLLAGTEIGSENGEGPAPKDIESGIETDHRVQEKETAQDGDGEPDSVDEPVTENDTDSEEDPGVIDPGEAVDVSGCLITQDALDELISRGPEPVEDQGAVDEQVYPDGTMEDTSQEGPVVLDAGPELPGNDDLDSDLQAEDISMDIDGGEISDVTQEDIDALLRETDDDDELLDDEDDLLISQDDIDTLLMAADQEDEDLLGNLIGDDEDFEENFTDEYPGEDLLDNGEDDDLDQVVLEGEMPVIQRGEADSEEKPGPGAKFSSILKSKIVLAAASVLLVIGIAVPIAYFLFFSSSPVPAPIAIEVPTSDIEVAGTPIESDNLETTPVSGTLVLADFVILASEMSKGMAYVKADISIDYSDQRTYHEINSNLSFYRDMIYDAIHKSLVSEKGNEVTQTDLLWGIETSLKKLLPPRSIDKVSFKSFQTS